MTFSPPMICRPIDPPNYGTRSIKTPPLPQYTIPISDGWQWRRQCSSRQACPGFSFKKTKKQAQARPQYLKWWLKEFPDVAKKNNLKASSCNVCHVGAKKANRNDYGKALTKALAPKKNVKDKDTFDDAVKAAAKEKGPDADKTFGELLEAGDLPSK